MATTYLTPGVYFRPAAVPAPAVAPRTDVAGFVGLAERGPIDEPRRLTTFRQFQQVFGGFLPYAHLAYAVRAFFENGGAVCWVVRVAAGAQAARPLAEEPFPIEAASPGTWGNDLAVEVQPASLAPAQVVERTRLIGENVARSELLHLDNTVGIETGTRLRITLNASRADGTRVDWIDARVAHVDPIVGEVRFAPPFNQAGLSYPEGQETIRVESREFDLIVRQAGQVSERFVGLAVDEAHRRFAVRVVNEQSALVRLAPTETRPLRLPDAATPPFPLRGGVNGLRGLSVEDFVGGPGGPPRGLGTLAAEDEVGILAIPDLMAAPPRPELTRRARRRAQASCAVDQPQIRITILGAVRDAETEQLLGGVTIAGGPACVESIDHFLPDAGDAKANFSIPDVPPGRYELDFCLAGYETRTLPVDVSAGGQDLKDVFLTPRDLPPPLSQEQIARAQAALIDQCTQQRDRFAILDPPLATARGTRETEEPTTPCDVLCQPCAEAAPDRPDRVSDGDQLDVADLLAWRSRFASEFAALYYPWLRVIDPLRPEAPQGRLVPPSGHVAGVYAATDLAEGPFRAPANRELDWTEDVAVAIDDTLHGVLNPVGINAIRAFPGRGVRVFGARTLSSDSARRFINVRRLLSFLEESIHDSLQWAVFEPNDASLRLAVRVSLLTLLDGLWRRGAFVGATAEAAYDVRCDAVTTPPEAQAAGRLLAEVRVAPTVPYEFVVLRLGIAADELRVSEV